MIDKRIIVSKFTAEIIDLEYRILAVISEAGRVLGIVEFQDGKYSDLRKFACEISCAGRQAIKIYKRECVK
jgi:hypothetical protein